MSVGLEKLQVLASSHAMDHFALFDIQHQIDCELFPNLLMHDLNPTQAERIESFQALKQSSVFRVLARTNTPFRWLVGVDAVTGTRIGKTKADEEWDQLFDGSDIVGGYCVPAQGPEKRRTALLFFKKLEKPKARYADLAVDVLELFEQELAVAIDDDDQPHRQTLSASERSCLVWCACGKTSGEIGTILSLSEHTVNHYFTIAGQKLGTNNRVHTVARAIKLGLIDLSELN